MALGHVSLEGGRDPGRRGPLRKRDLDFQVVSPSADADQHGHSHSDAHSHAADTHAYTYALSSLTRKAKAAVSH